MAIQFSDLRFSINSLHVTLDRLNSGRYKKGNKRKTAITSAGEKDDLQYSNGIIFVMSFMCKAVLASN